jgi:hypothetical protein
MKIILALIALISVSLTGCASLNQAYSAYGASSLVGVQGAEDNVIKTWTVAACSTPLDAAIRNPQIVPALQALCIPGGSQSSPASLLTKIPTAKPAN